MRGQGTVMKRWTAMTAGLGTLLAGGVALAGGGAPGEVALASKDHEYWSIFKEILPDAFWTNMSTILGPSELDPTDAPYITPIVMSLFVFFIGLMAALAANRKMKNPEDVVLPSTKWSLFTVFDVLIEGLFGLMEGMMTREQAIKYLPYVVSVFCFILMGNAMAMVPGMLPPTDNLSTTAALGIIAFLAYNWWGIQTVGLVAHIKHLMGPLPVLAPLMFIIEVISHAVRPCSLALRLAGNMYGDHKVLGIFLGFQALGIVLVPLPVMLLGTVVVIVQAVVFTLLTIVYISMAVETHDDHGEEAGAH